MSIQQNPKDEMRKAFEVSRPAANYARHYTRPEDYQVITVQIAWEAFQQGCAWQREQDALHSSRRLP